MATKIEICNMALANLGTAKTIASIDERSVEAISLNRFYNNAKDETLRGFEWPFAKKFIALGLVEKSPFANGVSDWGFSYSYPSDCLMAKSILSGIRNDNRQSRVVFEEVQNATGDGKLIYTDQENATLQYISTCPNEILFSADFVSAFSYLLSFYIAPLITGGNAFAGITDKMMQLHQMKLNKAKQSAANEPQQEQVPESEFVRSREGYETRDPWLNEQR